MPYQLRTFALQIMLMLVIVWIAVGCHSKTAPSALEPVVDSALVAPVSINSKNTSFKSLKKPGASVSIKNIQPMHFISLGVQNIELLLDESSGQGTMNVRISASDGVTLVNQSVFHFELSHSSEYKLPLTFSLEQNGRHYLRLHVEVVADGVTERRVISAILQVGETAQRIQKSQGESADMVLTLPAEETVLAQ